MGVYKILSRLWSMLISRNEDWTKLQNLTRDADISQSILMQLNIYSR